MILAACVVNVGMCFIWPTLEALVSEGDPPAHVPHAVGIYNIVWAVTNAAAFFIGGTLVEKFGYECIFYLPLALMVLQLALMFWLEKIHAANRARAGNSAEPPPPDPHRPSPAQAKTFLAHGVAGQSVRLHRHQHAHRRHPRPRREIPCLPDVRGLRLSLWCFVRLGTFVVLWRWTGWHYRFRWLATSFAVLILSFATILLRRTSAVLIVAQIFFGGAIGLIYYSSLFYSMDGATTKSEHGGIHEAAIGLGNCVGPAMGAAALQFLPQYANSGAIAVSVLLLGGFGGLVAIWKTAR